MWGVRTAWGEPGESVGPARVVSITATLRADGSSFDATVEPLLPLSDVQSQCFTLTTHGPGSIEIICLAQAPATLGTIIGTFDSTGSAPVSWQPGRISMLEPAPPIPIQYLTAHGEANSDALEVFASLSAGEGLWSSAKRAGSKDWEPWAPIVTKGGYPQMLQAGETKFLYGAGGGLGIWERNPQGDWDVELIEIPTDAAAPVEEPGFRVGVTLFSADLPLGGASLNVTASLPARCTVSGTCVLLDSIKPTPFLTDATGTVWITLKIQDRFCVPDLTLTSDAFSGSLEVTSDVDIQHFLANLSGDELAAGVDPRTKPPTKILPDPANASHAAEAVRESMKMVTAARTLTRTTVESRRGSVIAHGGAARWTDHDRVQPSRLLPTDAFTGLDAWSLEVTNGKASFSRLDPAQAKSQREAMLALPAMPRPMSIFDDAFDWVGDLAKSVWDGLVEVTKMVTKILVDGAKMVINLVVDGVSYAYQGVIDTLERAYDAVTFVLHAVGVVMGKALGWLLSKLGFLFDWDALKGKRDELKTLLRSGLRSLHQSCPDPATTAANIAADLKTTEAAFDAWIAQYRSSPTDTQTFGGQTSSVFKSLEPLLQGSGSSFAEITWLIEKARDALLSNMGLSGAPAIPGLAAAVGDLQQSVGQAAQSFSPTLDDASTLFSSWVLGGKLFSSSRFDPLLTVVQKHVDQLLGGIGDIAIQSGSLLHLLWQHPDEIIDWLDSPINVPFFAGFYEGLTGNKFSLLDMVCMCAAVPASALSSADASRMDVAVADGWRIAGMSFAIIGCLTEGWASFEIASSKADGYGTDANAAADLACGLCAVIHGLEEKRMLNFGVVYMMAAVAIVVGKKGFKYREQLGPLISFLMLIVRLPLAATSDTKMTISQLLLMVQNLLEGYVSRPESKKPDPRVFAALQASLSGAATGLAYS